MRTDINIIIRYRAILNDNPEPRLRQHCLEAIQGARDRIEHSLDRVIEFNQLGRPLKMGISDPDLN